MKAMRGGALLLAAGLWLAAGAVVQARPGGGQGYSGGSQDHGGGDGGASWGGGSDDSGYDGSASGGSGDGSELGSLVLYLGGRLVDTTRTRPLYMLPLWAGIGLLIAFRHRLDVDLGDWSLGSVYLPGDPEAPSAQGAVPEPEPEPRLPRAELEQLREDDPDFSVVLFEDFAHALFARAHEARGRGGLDALAAHLSAGARAALARDSAHLAAVEGIVVGAMRYHRVSLEPGSLRVRVILELEANYTEVPRAGNGRGEPRGLYARERWTLTRLRSARSRPPERIRSLGCPGCAGPLEAPSGPCPWCGAPFEAGAHDWLVAGIDVLRRERRAPALTSHTPIPSYYLFPDPVVDPELQGRRAELEARDPEFRGAAFHARIRHLFTELQPAWSELDLARARPWLSDNLFETWRYWIEAYRRAGLRNVSEGARIEKLRTVRVVSDLHYDAITVWLRASGLDYTVDAGDHLVSGDRERRREYCEYWTLIRARGVRGSARADRSCPRCGGPLAVSMAGACESCGAHVTAGEFDWVLSRIEQGTGYQG